MKSGCLAIEMSTVSVEWVRDLSSRTTDAGSEFVEAPVSGSLRQVEERVLSCFAWGSTAAVDRARPLLEDLGAGSVEHMGPASCGMALKLAANVLLAAQVVAMAEVLTLLRHTDADLHRFVDVLKGTPMCSPSAGLHAVSCGTRHLTYGRRRRTDEPADA